MTLNLQHFIGERAEDLAVVYLTRSRNLAVERMSQDYGFDLLVTLLQDEKPTGQLFGVQVKGQEHTLSDIQHLRSLLSQQEINSFQDLPFPLCLFLFTMDNDQGYYRWVRYPCDEIACRLDDIEQWHRLDPQGLEQIINDVKTWYEAKRHSAA